MPRRRVLVQAGHKHPREPGRETQTGAAGEIEVVTKVGRALVAKLEQDARFEARLIPGRIPDDVKDGSWKVDAFIALHCDGAGSTEAVGYSFGYPSGSRVNARLAELIGTEFAKFHPSRRRPDNNTPDMAEYYGWSRVPTAGPEVLVEHGFVSNPAERTWLNAHAGDLAQAEYQALLRFFRLRTDGRRPRIDHDAEWPWFAEWALWTLGRGKYEKLGKKNAEARPTSAPRPVPRRAHTLLREIRRPDEEPEPKPRPAGKITAQTVLLAPARASLEQARRYLLARPHGGYSDAQVRRIAKLYFDLAPTVGLDPLLVVAQMILETGNLGSDWSQPPRRNPAGIGVTGEPGAGISFPSWTKAVEAHVGRLLAYSLSAGRENAAQRRVIEAALAWRPLPDSLRGAAPSLAGLARTWAADPAYAGKICRVANDIRA